MPDEVKTARQLVRVPSLDDASLDALRGLPFETLAALRERCAAKLATIESAQPEALAARHAPAPAPPAAPASDRLLDVNEAAAKLGMSRSQLYRRKDLPFRVKVGPGQLRFSLLGIERWLRARTRAAASDGVLPL
jgi:predicted DNA-binding transcriptional regulator AlpA